MIDPLSDLLGDDGFRTGLAYGAVAALAVALVAAAHRRLRPWPGAGLAFAAAAVAALDQQLTVESDLVVALAVLAAGGFLTGRAPLPVRLVAAVPGAMLLARAADAAAATEPPDWALGGLVVATVAGGLGAEVDAATGRRGLPLVMVAVTAFGVYVTTPDTEHTVIVLGAALPLVLLAWPRPLATLATGGSLLAAGTVSWAVVVDGIGRPGAMVGGLACLGMLVVEPLARWGWRAAGGIAPSGELPRLALVLGLHVALVAACSRVAGLRTSATEALVLAAVAYAATAAAFVAVASRQQAAPDTPRHRRVTT
jgi:hypothetical protein